MQRPPSVGSLHRQPSGGSPSSVGEASPSDHGAPALAQWPPRLRALSGTLGTGGSRPCSAGMLRQSPLQSRTLAHAALQVSAATPSYGSQERPKSQQQRRRPQLSQSQPALGLGTGVSGRGSPASLSRCRFPATSLWGVSLRTGLQNDAAGVQLSLLSRPAREDYDGSGCPSGRAPRPAMDEDMFVAAAETIDKSIEALKGRLHEFDASSPGGAVARGPARKANSGSHHEEEAERRERRRERFEAYKMARKIEPEPPPLDRSGCNEELRSRSAGSLVLVKRNASPLALRRHRPENRLERARSLVLRQEDRRRANCTARDVSSQEKEAKFAAALDRKMRQGRAVMEKRRRPGPAGHDTSHPCAARWAAFIAAIGFSQEAIEMLKLNKMSIKERMSLPTTLDSSHRRRSTSSRLPAVAEPFDMGSDVDVFVKVAIFLQARCRIIRRRRSAKMCLSALVGWQTAGRTFIHFKQFSLRIRFLQRWWRETSVKLKDVRELVSRRWVNLEQQLVVMEKRKYGDSYYPYFVPEAVRQTFLRFELRARRHRVVPQIEMWQEDRARWYERVQDWITDRTVRKAMGQDPSEVHHAVVGSPDLSTFHWPAARPSYLPPRHPNHDAFGKACSEDCVGRRGDKEILRMITAARDHPDGGGWLEVRQRSAPATSGKAKGALAKTAAMRSTSSRGGVGPRARRRRSGAGRSTSPDDGPDFADVDEQELRLWGADEASLPGLGPSAGEALEQSSDEESS